MSALIRLLMNAVRVCYPFLYMVLAMQFALLIFEASSTGGQRVYPLLAPVLPVLQTSTTVLAYPVLLVFNAIGGVLPMEVRLWFPVASVEQVFLTLGKFIEIIPLMGGVAKPVLDYDWANAVGGGFHWAYMAAIWLWRQLEKPIEHLFKSIEKNWQNSELEAKSEVRRQQFQQRSEQAAKGSTHQPVSVILERPKKKGPEFREVVDTLKNENTSLKERVNTDSLTCLYNKAYFNTALTREVELLRPMQGALALMMVDIDDFKAINDTYGHPQGDQILIAVAGECQKLRAASGALLPCRIGGEEIAMIMAGVDAGQAEMLAEQFRKMIERLSFKHPSAPEGSIKVTVSIGLLAVRFSATTEAALLRPADMIQRADEMMYRAKQKGKNQVVLWRVD